jgi:hypothetical protein
MMVHQNFHKIKVDARKEDEMEAMKKELSKLNEKKKAREAKREASKEEEKKIECMLFDLLKGDAIDRDKLKMIKLIYDESFVGLLL